MSDRCVTANTRLVLDGGRKEQDLAGKCLKSSGVITDIEKLKVNKSILTCQYYSQLFDKVLAKNRAYGDKRPARPYQV